MKRLNIILLSFSVILIANAQENKKLNVAVFVHQGVELLDFSGPFEVFVDAGYNVYTVAASMDVITSQQSLKIVPNYSFDDCPSPDIIILPGGATKIPLEDPRVIAWIKSQNTNDKYILSVCTGALLLAKSGLLDGKTATTHYCCLDNLAQYEKINVVKGKRFVDNGNIITTEGISAGIDGSLYLVGRMLGKTKAEEVAHYMMYDWKPEKLDVIIKPD
jgi:transcriptional regulator GlxA family with amidase domain